jgi:hypothetical protein
MVPISLLCDSCIETKRLMNQWNPKETRAIGESAYLLGGDAKPRGNCYRNKRVTRRSCKEYASFLRADVPRASKRKQIAILIQTLTTRSKSRGGLYFCRSISIPRGSQTAPVDQSQVPEAPRQLPSINLKSQRHPDSSRRSISSPRGSQTAPVDQSQVPEAPRQLPSINRGLGFQNAKK